MAKPPKLFGTATPVTTRAAKRPAATKPHTAAKRAQTTKKGKARKARSHAGNVSMTFSEGLKTVEVELGEQADPRDDWRVPGPSIDVLGESFQVFGARTGLGLVNISTLVEELDWDDSTSIMAGSVKLREAAYVPSFGLREGDTIILRARDTDGRFKEWWRMRIITPASDYLSGTRSFSVANDLWRLRDSKAWFKYVKSKERPKGWTCSNVILDVCKKYGIPCAPIPEMKGRITNYGPRLASPWDVILRVLTREKEQTGIIYTPSFEAGKLVFRPMARSPRLLLLSELLIQAGYSASLREPFATALHMRAVSATAAGTDKKGHKKTKHKPIEAFVKSPEAIKQYGLVTRMGFTQADSLEQLVKKGQRRLTFLATPDRAISASHPGVVGVRRNDAMRVQVHTDEDIFDQVLFVKEVRWQLSQANFDMDLVLATREKWWEQQGSSVKDTREEVAIKRGRKKKTTKATKKPAPARNANRATKKATAPAKTTTKPGPKLFGTTTNVKRAA